MTDKPVTRVQAVLLLSAASGMGVSLLLTIAAGRMADVEGFALFALVGSFFSLARDLLDLGTTAVAVRSAMADPSREARAYEQLLAWRLMMSLPLALVCLGYVALQPGLDSTLAMGATAATIVVMHRSGLIAVFQKHERLDIPSYVHIAVQAASLLAVGLLWDRLAQPLTAVSLLIGRELAIVVATNIAASRLLGYLPSARLRDMRLSLITNATSRYAAAAIAFHTILHSGTFILRLMVSTEAFAGYASAFRLMLPVMGLPWLLTAPLVPAFMRAAADPTRFANYFRGQFMQATTLACALAAAGAIVAPDIIAFVYDGKFTQGEGSAFNSLRWLMLAFVGVVATAIRAPALLALGWEDGLLRLALAAAGLTVVGIITLTPIFGIEGTAASVAIGAMLAGLSPVGPGPARVPFSAIGYALMVAAGALAALVPTVLPEVSGFVRIVIAGIAALAAGLVAARLQHLSGAADGGR